MRRDCCSSSGRRSRCGRSPACPRETVRAGGALAIVNDAPTPFDDRAALVVRDRAGVVLWRGRRAAARGYPIRAEVRHHEPLGRTILVLLVTGMLPAGCGGEPESRPSHRRRPRPSDGACSESPSPPRGTSRRRPPSPHPRCAAATARRGRGGAAWPPCCPTTRPTARPEACDRGFGLRNANGVPTTFQVLRTRLGPDCSPPGTACSSRSARTGPRLDPREAARRYSVDYRIVVDLSDRVVTVFKGGEELVRTRTAIGRPETPTPTGSFYVNQRFLTSDPSGPFGPGGSASRRSRPCSPAGRRAVRSRSTAPTCPRASASPPRTAACGSRTTCSSG